jgi:small subunit ribosomal protein S9
MEIIHTIGSRKTASARIYIKKGNGKININGINYKKYFFYPIYQKKILKPLHLSKCKNKYNINIKVYGGGLNGQSEAISLAISRGICIINPDLKKILKKEKLLTRDSRMVERKKFGQKKSRKKFQFSKR